MQTCAAPRASSSAGDSSPASSATQLATAKTRRSCGYASTFSWAPCKSFAFDFIFDIDRTNKGTKTAGGRDIELCVRSAADVMLGRAAGRRECETVPGCRRCVGAWQRQRRCDSACRNSGLQTCQTQNGAGQPHQRPVMGTCAGVSSLRQNKEPPCRCRLCSCRSVSCNASIAASVSQ